jgi:hypothetical protein
MGSWVAVEPSGKGLPSMLETSKPFWAVPSCRASVSGALSIIALKDIIYPAHLNIASSSNIIRKGLDTYMLKPCISSPCYTKHS